MSDGTPEFEPYTHADFLQKIEPQVVSTLTAIERYFSNAADAKMPLNTDEIIKQLAPAISQAIEPIIAKKQERRFLSLLVSVGVCSQEMLVEYDKQNQVVTPSEIDVSDKAMGALGEFPPIG